MLLAQEFVRVRREVDDEQAPARPQRMGGLAHGAAGIVEIVKDLMDDHEVIAIALDGQRIKIALT